MNDSPLGRLPDELLESIVFHLPPRATLDIGTTCKRCNKVAFEHLVWRRHCTGGWKYWEGQHEIQNKLLRPPAQTKWRYLYNERRKLDGQALGIFEELLKTQQYRTSRIEDISKFGYDVKDLLLELRDNTPDDAEDVLARRYYADVVLGQIHRTTALEKWTRLQKSQMVSLEEVLGAYDLFVLAGRKGDLHDIDDELERLANAVKARDPEFDGLSIRTKAVNIARFLRSEELVGNPNQEDYHALRNNFISIALFDEVHASLPLQSVAIYCAVARKLGVDAEPSNYPAHVHAVITAPATMTLDGKRRTDTAAAEPEAMYMDPWRSDEEVPREQLTLRLRQMGAPPAQHAQFLGAAKKLEITLRTGRNIMNSVQEIRSLQEIRLRQQRHSRAHSTPDYPDVEAAWYSMLWSMMILGDSNADATLHRRRQCLSYLVEHFRRHFPEDLALVERHIVPMFESEREYGDLLQMIVDDRMVDRNAKPICRRPDKDGSTTTTTAEMQWPVHYYVGQHFRHKRFGYTGFVIGWTTKCTAGAAWIHQMHVDDLPRGREQPFFHVM